MNTKGQTWEELVKWIAALAGFVALVFVVIYFFNPVVIEAQTREACEQSVLLKAQTKILEKEANIPLKCKTNVIKIEDEKQLKEANEKIANSIVDCWNQFGKGEIDFLSGWDFGSADTYCFPCTQIQFNPQLKGNKLELGTYLKEKLIPEKKLTYLEYIGQNNIGEDVEDFVKTISSFNTDQSIYIVFSARKNFDYSDLKYGRSTVGTLTKLGGCALGAKAGAAIGAWFGVIGAIPGAAAGCGLAGTIVVTSYYLTEKDKYTPGFFIGNSDKIMEKCGYPL